MKHDDFGDRMKAYESVFTSASISREDWICVRLDGKGFSKFTKKFSKPFDMFLYYAFSYATKKLIKETKAVLAFTQSDEITLLISPSISKESSEHWFGGKVSKLNSILASMCTAWFNEELQRHYPSSEFGFFDCRVWSVPSIIEASNVLLWRAKDARKNSVSCMFRHNHGHKKMKNLSRIQMLEQLPEWETLDTHFRYGSFYIWDKEDFIAKTPNGKEVNAERKYVKKVLHHTYYGDLTLDERVGWLSSS